MWYNRSSPALTAAEDRCVVFRLLTNLKTRKVHEISRLTKDIANMEEEKKAIEEQLATIHQDFAASRAVGQSEVQFNAGEDGATFWCSLLLCNSTKSEG